MYLRDSKIIAISFYYPTLFFLYDWRYGQFSVGERYMHFTCAFEIVVCECLWQGHDIRIIHDTHLSMT